jgi:hypothetical protein
MCFENFQPLGSFKIKMQFAIDDLAQTNYNENINKTQQT